MYRVFQMHVFNTGKLCERQSCNVVHTNMLMEMYVLKRIRELHFSNNSVPTLAHAPIPACTLSATGFLLMMLALAINKNKSY